MEGEKKETRVLKREPPSWNFYYCPYILRTGEVCNRRCFDPKGCKVHRNSRQVLCKECGDPTRSKYDYCDTHAKNIDRRNITIEKSWLSKLMVPKRFRSSNFRLIERT
ncbi:hypothetical protein GLOIN_2v1791272 [Rhizophagus irregularis DAOM 181602=DAOM 197198]|nr:hypothetical protein GLOIN_2v1791272 [Rhizophagus irregularis DAOM 181602=DAOM 197198]